ncbi:MAG: aminopeptidase P family protein [Deltaproteobacteria bacterium]|nr:aminopeptidase P family protein [Deltaproteobacteria bacterium]
MTQSNGKLERVVELLGREGLNGLVVYSEGICSILSPSYLHYFSEVRPLGPRSAAVVSGSGRVALLVEPAWDAARVAEKSWISDVRGTRDFAADLPGLLRELGVSGPVGLAGSKEITEPLYAAASSAAELRPADGLIEELAREKSAKELEVIHEAARIADVGFQAFYDAARPGLREYELVAEMEAAMRAAGADDDFILLSSGPHNDEMHEPTDRRLRKGDVLIGEITPVKEGQFMQWCRTVVLGTPPPVMYEKYDLLLRALDASLQEVRAGAEASGLAKAMNRVLSDAGYAKYCYPPYMRARGHGFGVGSIAPGGVVDEDTKTKLALNQAVVVHPNQYIPETGYLACGETYLVGETGPVRLSRTETKLHVKEVGGTLG